MIELTLSQPRTHAWGSFSRFDPRFAGGAVALAVLSLPLLLAFGLDTRLFQDEWVWIKPLKFALSLCVYLLTLVWAARYIPSAVRTRRSFAIFQWVVLFCIAGEMLWIGGAAMFGVGSHFNIATPVMATIYGIMGAFAVTLTSAAAVYGWLIWRHSAAPEASAIGASFLATFIATVIVAGYMSSYGSHFVGTPPSGAATVPGLGWSREVGDLRVSHFIATHIMQAVPLAVFGYMALLRRAPHRLFGFALTALALLAVAGSFVQALAGQPVWPI